jgi:hypothetical protein
MLDATSENVLITSATFALIFKPEFSSDLLALVDICFSNSLIAIPWDLTTSLKALKVDLTISWMFRHSFRPYLNKVEFIYPDEIFHIYS